jgi:hypothetical protein
MLAKHIETQILQHLQIVLHRFTVRRRVQAVRPVTLVQSAELEDKLAIEKRALDSIDFPTADSAESSVAADDIVSKGDRHVVKLRRIGRPELGTLGLESERRVGAATMAGKFTAVGIEDLDFDVRGAVVRGVYCGVHFTRLISIYSNLCSSRRRLPVPSAPADN